MYGWEREEDKKNIKIDGRNIIVMQKLKYKSVNFV
jgi:hypothetical protein